MASTIQFDTIFHTLSEIHRRAWMSFMESVAAVRSIESTTTVSPTNLTREGDIPMIVLVDAPGVEQWIALQPLTDGKSNLGFD